MTLETVIGLEVHVQLKTASKLFCRCETAYGADPNSQICPVCAGHPGVLPVLNRRAVELLVRAGLGLGCEIAPHSVFARKQYFYPDLPKAYQISQYDLPLARNGRLEILGEKGERRTIRILRIHLEEDAGKLLHTIGSRELDHSLVDLNRAGIPLAECVSEPDLRSPDEAHAYLTALKQIFQYLGISDCDMEKGSLRCDANISLRPVGQAEYGTKAEIKNLNSFKAVRDALNYEIKRQTDVLSAGGRVKQETRLWDDARHVTESMRSKEEAHDYRYFPDPDLVPLELPREYLDQIRRTLPELPDRKKARFVSDLKLSEYDAGVLVADAALAAYFEEALAVAGQAAAKPVCNWISTELLGRLNASGKSISESPVSPSHLAQLVGLVQSGAITGKVGKDVFQEMFDQGGAPGDIVKAKGLTQVGDEATIARWCDEAIAEMPKAVSEYKGGKETAIGSLIGLVMKKSAGKANPQTVRKLLVERLRQH